MDRSPILFRCDASPELGWESFYQCMVYAAALQRRRRPCYFLGHYEPFQLLSLIARGGNEFIINDQPLGTSEDCDATIREVRRLNAAAVIVAGRDLTTDYLRELGSNGAIVVVLDYDAKTRFPNRLVINPLLAPEIKAYQWDRGTQLLLGERYALVRSIFRRQRQVRVGEPQGTTYRAILAFGDNDFTGQSLQRAEELLAGSRIDRLTVVSRTHHYQFDDLKELAAQSNGRMEVLSETSELSTRLSRAHFVITSGDTLSLEFACVGVPQLVISQSQRHLPNAIRLDEEGAANYLGRCEEVTALQLRDAVNNLLEDQLERVGMSRCARQLIDGRGPDRVVNGLEILLHPLAADIDEQRLAA